MNILERLNIPKLIHDVDVRECKYFGNPHYCECEKNPDCYYKEWQRAKSEKEILIDRICSISVDYVTSRQCQEIIRLKGKIDRYKKVVDWILNIEEASFEKAPVFARSAIYAELKKLRKAENGK